LTADPAKRILIAPLDWGFGHTTRCIPIIRRLLRDKREVIFAGNDIQQTFIHSFFPDLTMVPLEGYDVHYSASSLFLTLFSQFPRLKRKIREEHDWLMDNCQKLGIDRIISDNRYGLWHPEIPSVIMTHQAEIQTGMGHLSNQLIRKLHYQYLNRFQECWIVDQEEQPNLGAALSHPSRLSGNSKYIGWLSQFEKPAVATSSDHLLVLLSGPEPQRSILSDLLWTQCCLLDTPIIFVEGNAQISRNRVPTHIRHFSILMNEPLQDCMERAQVVICRSGYSSLMDLLLLGKPAILIPTPGQTEQEYLARQLNAQGYFYSEKQVGFSLEAALKRYTGYDATPLSNAYQTDYFVRALDDFMNANK